MTRVAVVIPNWNGLRWLGPCLQALDTQSFRDFRTIVVDNGSQDGSPDWLRDRHPEVQLVALPQNLGFAAGMNAGIAAAGGVDYVAALNNDTEADPGWLGALVAALDDTPKAGAAASLMLSLQNPQIVDTAGDGYGWTGLSFKLASGRDRRQVPDVPYPVLGASAGACLYRRRMLDEIGAFDPDYFAYMEDVDLALRAQLAGWTCLAVPASTVRHAGAASSGGGPSAFSLRLTTRNMLVTIVKNAPALMVPVMLGGTFALQIGAVGQSFLTGRPGWLAQNRRAWVAGVGAALRAFPAALAHRWRTRGQRRMTTAGFIRMLAASARQRREMAGGAR
jgi:GT2 family glycosyltransferase